MASTTESHHLPGAWFGELAAALQGSWHAVAATGEEGPRPARQIQQQKPEGGAVVTAGTGKDKRQGGDVARCCGGMSDTTLYMLLDRFSPS